MELHQGRRYLVGRAPHCDLVLDDPRVSREQLAIEVGDCQVDFHKLGGKNAVFLNGSACDGSSFAIGDIVSIGRTSLTLSSGEVDGDPEGTDDDSNVKWVAHSDPGDSQRIEIDATDPEASFDRDPNAPHIERLEALYRLSERMVTGASLSDLFDEVSLALHENLPAQRGFIALGDPERDQFEVVKVSADATESRPGSIEMSETILEEIQIRRQALLVEDVRASFEEAADQSIRAFDIRAFMCAPMLVHEDFVGMIYVDQRGSAPRKFERHDLQYLKSTARLLALALDDRLMREQLQSENRRLRELLTRREQIVATTPPMLDVLSRVSRAAKRESSVLILGETGTGKECVARLLHDESDRREGPFVAFNCALSSPALIESELFGHTKGAFTDASRSRKGKLELAHGGTLLLDEIGDMPLDTQVKLLRVLQERQIWPVGSEEPIPVDIRILAATHRDLDELRRKGQFRDDLYFRIAVLKIEIPPLRDRGEDIVRIGESLLPEEFEIDGPARRAMLAYAWPGNIRELQNAMEHACFNATGDTIRLSDLPEDVSKVGRRDRVETRIASLAEIEARQIRKALEAFSGNKKRTAEVLGISRDTLYQKIKNYGI